MVVEMPIFKQDLPLALKEIVKQVDAEPLVFTSDMRLTLAQFTGGSAASNLRNHIRMLIDPKANSSMEAYGTVHIMQTWWLQRVLEASGYVKASPEQL